MDLWNIHIPTPLALVVVATLGYLVSRWHRPVPDSVVLRSRRELKRAQAVAAELERIAWTISQGLSKYQVNVSKFKDKIDRLGDRRHNAWSDLCREAESILKPTLKLASEISGAYDEIRQQSSNLMSFAEVRTDPLTGVTNRRGLDEAIRSQLAIMARYHVEFSAVIFDVDHFKLVNDREGHVHGDRVLQGLAALLEECVRDTDVVGRFGGEEFVIVMPQTDLAGANTFAERLRSQVAEHLTITISGGVTVAVPGDTSESLIARADTALYSAKEAGRNCVFYRSGEETGPVVPERLPQEDRDWSADDQQPVAVAGSPAAELIALPDLAK